MLQRTLADIEAIRGFTLPDSAYDDQGFWARPLSRIARTLAAVGWQAQLRPHKEAVMFTRTLPATP